MTEAMVDEEETVNVSAILNQFMVGYDKRVRPNYGGIPVTVGVSLYILSIGDLSEKYMDFTFDMYFRQFWHDPRLSFEERPSLKKLVVGAEYIKGSFKKFFYQFSKILEFLSKKPIRSIRLFVKIFPSETFMLSWSLWKVGAAVGGQLLYLLVRLILNPFYEAAVIILRKK